MVTRTGRPLEGTTLFRNLIIGLSLAIYTNRTNNDKKGDRP